MLPAPALVELLLVPVVRLLLLLVVAVAAAVVVGIVVMVVVAAGLRVLVGRIALSLVVLARLLRTLGCVEAPALGDNHAVWPRADEDVWFRSRCSVHSTTTACSRIRRCVLLQL